MKSTYSTRQKNTLKFSVKKSTAALSSPIKKTKLVRHGKPKIKITSPDLLSVVTETSSPEERMQENIDVNLTLRNELDRVLQALGRNMPDTVLCRDNQIGELKEILTNCLKNKESVSVYISGCSGSGKTITLKTLLAKTDIARKFRKIFTNCMNISDKQIFEEVARQLGNKDYKNANIRTIEKLISREKKPIILILDEVDAIYENKPNILHDLFALISTFPDGKIVLIGVGNTLNLINTLRLRKGIQPITFQFPSYNQHELLEIISQRLKNINLKQLTFSNTALEMLARKVAAFGGDARAALGAAEDSIHYVLENVDRNHSDQIIIIDEGIVTSKVNAVCRTVERFQQEKKGVSAFHQIDAFPLQQKLILCSLLLALKRKTCTLAQLNIQKIRDMYKTVCQQAGIDVLTFQQFLKACSLIETNQIFILKGNDLTSKVILKWDADEMFQALSKESLFGDILNHY